VQSRVHFIAVDVTAVQIACVEEAVSPQLEHYILHKNPLGNPRRDLKHSKPERRILAGIRSIIEIDMQVRIQLSA